MRSREILVAIVALGVLTSCASAAPAGQSAVSVAVDFHGAVSGGDGESACALLAPKTVFELEKQAGTECAQAILDAGLPDAAQVVRDSTYGMAAKVELDADILFLVNQPTGWLVSAAGCAPVPDQPYDCDVKGG